MVKINEDRESFQITRGDETTGKINRLAFYFEIMNIDTQEVHPYEFQLDDKIAFVAMQKRGYSKTEIFRKEYTPRQLGYVEPCTTLEIPITAEESKRFPLKNKAKTYWFDLILNDTITMAGYNEEGAAQVTVYPEPGELGE